MPHRKIIKKVHSTYAELGQNGKIAVGIAGAITLWMLTGVFSGGDSETVYTKEVKPKVVSVQVIAQQDYKPAVRITGQSEPFRLVKLAAQTAGQVETVTLDRGAMVMEGDLLLSIDMAARGERLAAAKASLKEAKALYAAAKKLNREGYRADTSLAGREAALASAKETLKTVQSDISYTKISSPIKGIVEDRLVDKGDYVGVGDPVYTLVSREKFKLTAYVPQKSIGFVKEGLNAVATLANGQEIDGMVTFVATNAEAVTRTYKVEITIDGAKHQIPTGMSADIRIPYAEEKAYLIPNSALVLSDAGDIGTILLDENNAAQFYPVDVLSDTGSGFYIEGLKEGLRLVTKGQASLQNGEVVKVIETRDANGNIVEETK